ncbi:sulfotransferase family protein [Kordiimonas aquimaris]|uniref:sulfotransferase family protein n=1 Tax=Kordiimonas aquimaris TaxID=707591 RepID=UPI0021D089D2|nr:sulfotransferase family protein [Kordiimonas aquimaris]
MNMRQIDEMYKEYGSLKVNQNIHISIKHKFVFIPVPKTGSTTLKKVFQSIEMRELKRKWIKPHPLPEHSPFIKPYQLQREQLSDILKSSEYVKFTFARNPYHRLYSAWRDKIHGNRAEKAQILKARQLDPENLEQDISFSEFIETIQTIDKYKLDPHWSPQYHEIFNERIKFDFIGKLERFDEDLSILAKMLKMPLASEVPEQPINNKSYGHKSTSSAYNSKDIRIATELYAEDFSFFNYPTYRI